MLLVWMFAWDVAKVTPRFHQIRYSFRSEHLISSFVSLEINDVPRKLIFPGSALWWTSRSGETCILSSEEITTGLVPRLEAFYSSAVIALWMVLVVDTRLASTLFISLDLPCTKHQKWTFFEVPSFINSIFSTIRSMLVFWAELESHKYTRSVSGHVNRNDKCDKLPFVICWLYYSSSCCGDLSLRQQFRYVPALRKHVFTYMYV